MNKLDANEIRTMFTTSTFNKGESYYKSGRVRNLKLDKEGDRWNATESVKYLV
ncbi:hypothetical protein [Sporosarcina sp. E16_8]|uniref:hypothetical protein n=1 Tax=Sporosarcina sp. E16_8 TaxID=2789295 RepID=UPI001A932D5C|nr:hypothetical protein [Sporosarcina sp. E16_8]MBO0588440.1 hypothetical protein [Sporosarcina sp. E16_8]